MARASRPKSTLASATHAAGNAPTLDIGAAMREAAGPARAPAPDQDVKERSTAPSRTGKRGVVGYVSPELWAQLRHLAIDEGTSVQGPRPRGARPRPRGARDHPEDERLRRPS